jgi:hypothetical protein
MLFFPVPECGRRGYRPAQPNGKKGAGGALVAKASSSVLLFHRLRLFGLVATPAGNMGSEVRRCSTFVRIKRGFGYTQSGSGAYGVMAAGSRTSQTVDR